MTYKNKAEAEQAIGALEGKALAADGRAKWSRGHKREHEETAAQSFRVQASRLQALLPTLPE